MNLERLVLLMRAVVTVIGKDAVGILAKVSTKCAEYNANVIEVTSQFCMTPLCYDNAC